MSPTVLLIDDNAELLGIFTQLLEEAGYRVKAFSRARPALESIQNDKPRAVVLDLLLPDMQGQRVAEDLKLMLPGVPLVLMTGVFKGGKLAEETRAKTGAAYYFEKPFDARELVRALHTLVPAGSAPAKTEGFDAELFESVEADEPMDPLELSGKIRVQGQGNITAELQGERIFAPAAARGTFPAGPAVPGKPAPQARRPSRSGILKDNFPALLNAFYQTKETGELGVQRGKVRKVVYFQGGFPVWARSNLAAERFGNFLVRVGRLRPELVLDVSTAAHSANRRTGDVLVERGLLTETERLYFLGQQVKSIIYSVFAWEEGSFELHFDPKATPHAVKLDVHPGNLILRGIKKLYKPERLVRLTPMEERLMPSANAPYELYELELEKWEAMLLMHIDGNRNNAELFALAPVGEDKVRAFLVAMTQMGQLEVRR
jgi:two-component system, OmpR family, response regulator